MTRNLKALCLALVAIFVTGALSASAASAADFFTTTYKGPAYLTGTSHDNVFSLNGGALKFECTTAKFTGTVLHGFSFGATVLPEYSGEFSDTPHSAQCDGTPGPVTIDVNDCHYKLTGDTTGSDSGTDATVWIQCPEGQTIKVTNSVGCTISIPSQTPTSGGVTYSNVIGHSGGDAIKVTETVTGITFTASPLFNCMLGGIPAHGNDGKYTGTVTLTGWEDSSGNSTKNLTNIKEGLRVGVSFS